MARENDGHGVVVPCKRKGYGSSSDSARIAQASQAARKLRYAALRDAPGSQSSQMGMRDAMVTKPAFVEMRDEHR